MAYSDFTTLKKALDAFKLKLKEQSFFPNLEPIEPGATLQSYLEDALPVAMTGSEKVKSEGIVFPLLLEARKIQNAHSNQISLFSGEDFTVDPEQGLSGICDFILCRSPLLSIIAAPVLTVVEAKKESISLGLGQCVAEMVAALRFNQADGLPATTVYGIVTTGTLWRYLALDIDVVMLDRTDYPLMPIAGTLAKILWMIR